MDREQTIEHLWEIAGHGARLEDIEKAYSAGVLACLEIAKEIHARATKAAHSDAEELPSECVGSNEAHQRQ